MQRKKRVRSPSRLGCRGTSLCNRSANTRSQQFDHAVRRAAIFLHHLQRPCTGGGACRVVLESPDHGIGELCRRFHAGKAVRRSEGRDHLIEIEGVGAHDQGLAAQRRLDRVVAAVRDEAATEEGDTREAVQVLQLAHRVADDDLCGATRIRRRS